jgi:hypothetical protein
MNRSATLLFQMRLWGDLTFSPLQDISLLPLAKKRSAFAVRRSTFSVRRSQHSDRYTVLHR